MKFLKTLNHWFFWARRFCVSLFDYAEIWWCLITKKLSFYWLSIRQRIGSVRGLSFNNIFCRTNLYRDLTSWRKWPMIFLLEHMCGGLFLECTVISVLGCFILSFGLCAGFAEAWNFQDNVSL